MNLFLKKGFEKSLQIIWYQLSCTDAHEVDWFATVLKSCANSIFALARIGSIRTM